MADEQFAREQFDGTTDFRGADVHLKSGVVDRIERERLDEPLFHYEARNRMLNATQMLEALLKQSDSGLQHFLPRRALDDAIATGEGRATPVFEAQIAKGFKYLKDGMLVDVEKISFDVEMVVRPRGTIN